MELEEIVSGNHGNEVSIQKFLKKNLWLFGNEYALVFLVFRSVVPTKVARHGKAFVFNVDSDVEIVLCVAVRSRYSERIPAFGIYHSVTIKNVPLTAKVQYTDYCY